MSLPKVAYFSMEMAIDPSLRTYAGGLGFLAGSHMLSAGGLNLPMVGVTILWTNGYGEQIVNKDGQVEIVYNPRQYDFLTDPGITVEVDIFGEPVKIKALKLEPQTFGTVPIYYLTTDIPENKPEHRELTHVLYEGDQRIRISQEIILGRGGFRVLEQAHEAVDLIHINEGHALPALFEMLDKFGGNLEEVRQRSVFTTHTPVASGNEFHPAELLAEAGFFAKTHIEEAIQLGGHDFSLTVAALRMCRLSNGVSQLHGQVANNMWRWVDHRCPIVAITNAVNLHYWQDDRIKLAKPEGNGDILNIKTDMKKELFSYIKKETGKDFDPDVLTIVWARRFTEYKRPTLIFRDYERIAKHLKDKKVQLIFAGKFHPNDTQGREMFNECLAHARELPGVAVLTSYELELSGLLKRGSDIWLNTPLRPLEASGTSGMAANMNGSLHLTTFDGWSVEGTYDGINGHVINETVHNEHLPLDDRHQQDYDSMMHILEERIIPTYYNDKKLWTWWMWNAIRSAEAYFHSDRMVVEYYNRLYRPIF